MFVNFEKHLALYMLCVHIRLDIDGSALHARRFVLTVSSTSNASTYEADIMHCLKCAIAAVTKEPYETVDFLSVASAHKSRPWFDCFLEKQRMHLNLCVYRSRPLCCVPSTVFHSIAAPEVCAV
jgi:hypothetical protein